jgi:protein SCO1/2
VVAIYFGYTTCPDDCPTTMGMLTAALNRLPPEEQAKVQVLLVSFDPARDTPQTLATYVKQFHPNIIGVTGTEEQVAAVAGQYGALYERVEMPDSAIGYVFDHSSVTAVMDVKGNIRSLVRHQDSVDDIIAKFREAMQG